MRADYYCLALDKIKTCKKNGMKFKFKTGDHVSWNSEGGLASGKIIKIHTTDFDYKSYTHHASKEDPQYEIKSDKTDHIAVHKGLALTKIRD
jgi:Hypervirulence associated proteins TUDOR domain